MKKSSFLKELENDLRKAKSKGDSVKEVEILYEIGENLFKDLRYDDCLTRFEKIIELCQGRRHSKLEEFHLEGLRRSIDCLIELDSLEEALARADTYVKMSRELKQEPHVQQALLNKARVSMHLAEKVEITEVERSELQEIAERMFLGSENSLCQMKKLKLPESELEIPRKRASLYQNMTQFFKNIGEREKAVEYMRRGIEVAIKSIDLSDVLLLLYTEGQAIYEKERSYQLCMQYGQKCLNILEKMKDRDEEKLDCMINISRYHLCVNDLDKSYSVLKKALKMKKAERFDSYFEALAKAKKIKLVKKLEAELQKCEVSVLAEKLEQLGDLYAELSAFQLSNDKYNEALELLKHDCHFSDKMFDLSLSVCLNLVDSKLYEEATEKYLFILSNLESTFSEVEGKESKLCRVLRHLCRCYCNLKDTPNCKFYLEKAINCAEDPGLPDGVEKCLDLRSQIKESKCELSVDSDVPMDEYGSAEAQNVDSLHVEISSDSEPENAAQSARNLMNRYKRNGKGETKLQEAVIKGKYDLVKDLIDKKYSVNVQDHIGWTPLHEAVNYGYVDICRLLVSAGAHVDKPMKGTGFTALMDAIQNEQFQCAKVLLESNAYPYYVGKIGICAADLFEWIVENRYSENNTTDDLKLLFEEIRALIDKKERPKSVKKVAFFDESVLEKFLVSNGKEQCPEVIEEKDENNSDQEYTESCHLDIYRGPQVEKDNNNVDEAGNAMRMYEEALKQQSSTNKLYRERTVNDIAKSDRIKEKRAKRENEKSKQSLSRIVDSDEAENDRTWVEQVRNKSQKSQHNGNDSDSGIQSISTSTSGTSKSSHRTRKSATESRNATPSLKVKRSKRVKSPLRRVRIDSSSESEKENETPPSKRHSKESEVDNGNRSTSKLKFERNVEKQNYNDKIKPEARTKYQQPVVDEFGYLNDSFVVSDKEDSPDGRKTNLERAISIISHNNDSPSGCNSEDVDLDHDVDDAPSPVIGSKFFARKSVTSTDHETECSSTRVAEEDVIQTVETAETFQMPSVNPSQQPLSSTMLDDHVLNSTVIDLPQNPIVFEDNLSPVLANAIRVTVHFITSSALVGLTSSVSVIDENDRVSDLRRKAAEKYKNKYSIEPQLQIKYKGKALVEDELLTDNVLSSQNNGRREVFVIVTGWSSECVREKFLKSCSQSKVKPCDYAREVVNNCADEGYELLGAIKYSNTEMIGKLLQSTLYQSIRHLALTEITMSGEHFDLIGRIVATCPNMTQMTLSKNRIDMEYLDRIVNECLRMSTANVFLASKLQFVNLKDNFLSGTVLSSIQKLAKFCSKIKKIELRNSRLDDNLIARLNLGDKRFFETIEKLDLRQNPTLSNPCKAKIFALFKTSCSIQL